MLNFTELSTIQKRERLNAVYRAGEPGPGGAYHDYLIQCENLPDGEAPPSRDIIEIQFQKGHRKDPEARHGVLDVDLLEIVRDRLAHFQQGDFATRETACALTHIEEALMWMSKRVEDRIERNVFRTYEK